MIRPDPDTLAAIGVPSKIIARIATMSSGDLIISREHGHFVRIGIYSIDTKQIPTLVSALFKALETQPDHAESTTLSIGTSTTDWKPRPRAPDEF